MSDEPSALLDQETQLQPEAIERTLRGLWQDMVDQNNDVTQVRMLNLLAYFPGKPGKELQQTINTIAVQHPGRAITLAPDHKAPRVETTIACRAGGDKLRACGEQIVLRGSVNGEPVHSLAIALLLGGLPVTVWWHGAVDFEEHIYDQLTAAADHVILDSRTWPDPAAQLQALSRLLRENEHHAWVSDLRWVALTSWRRIIAHSFDVTAARGVLQDIGEITIEYGEHEGALLDAILLAAWWMSRTERVLARVEHNTSEIVVRARKASGRQRRDLRVGLRAVGGMERISRIEALSTGEQRARVLFETIAKGRGVRTEVEVEDHPPFEQTSSLASDDLTALLGSELATVIPDPTYEGALHLASAVLGAM
jgi:glucose-6-phosphate dehydrogenase assembly protein OpcA